MDFSAPAPCCSEHPPVMPRFDHDVYKKFFSKKKRRSTQGDHEVDHDSDQDSGHSRQLSMETDTVTPLTIKAKPNSLLTTMSANKSPAFPPPSNPRNPPQSSVCAPVGGGARTHQKYTDEDIRMFAEAQKAAANQIVSQTKIPRSELQRRKRRLAEGIMLSDPQSDTVSDEASDFD